MGKYLAEFMQLKLPEKLVDEIMCRIGTTAPVKLVADMHAPTWLAVADPCVVRTLKWLQPSWVHLKDELSVRSFLKPHIVHVADGVSQRVTFSACKYRCLAPQERRGPPPRDLPRPLSEKPHMLTMQPSVLWKSSLPMSFLTKTDLALSITCSEMAAVRPEINLAPGKSKVMPGLQGYNSRSVLRTRRLTHS